ncbi:helix-turn-helix transcriptional regulator [Dactylosporangium roseum]|uniref:Helix-turn-helix transcriptional regulator n=1 Tax=Dactylosporangium roseum TaxID=47989 RepID=A0ABY5YZ65_9ACTN|nr:helix-turn-helix transcriptional regulator [Dactylosporangium roseum]UWZ35045.1 helix-turn-helix transcriptional regulator [Dactylosporangium roseum]
MGTHDASIPRLDEETLALYRRVLEMDLLDAAALEQEFGPDGAQWVLDKLAEAHLVRPVPDADGMTVLRPDVAASAMIDPLETTIRNAQWRIKCISGQFDQLMAVYRSTVERRNQLNGVLDTITDPDAANVLVTEHIAAARKEVLVMCGTDPKVKHRFTPILPADAAPAHAGVRLCVLHQHAARYHQAVQDHAAVITGAGGQVRTIEKLWNHTCVIDQEMVFIYDHTGVVSVSQPVVAAAVAALFEQSWSMAKPFDGRTVSRSEGRELSGDVQRAILYFLAEGLRDERIARQIGVSVRTCRRHIAEVLEQLGATSRFQAGYLAAKHHILEPSR